MPTVGPPAAAIIYRLGTCFLTIMSVEPPRLRHSVQDFGDRLRITIPSRKVWGQIVLLAMWLLGLVGAGSVAIYALMIERSLAPILLFAFIGIFFSAIFTIVPLLWQLSGREVIEITSQAMTLQLQVLGHGLPQIFPAEHIRDLRIVPNVYTPLLALGVIAFECGARSVRIGSSIDEAEGKHILTIIQNRFPQYRSNQPIQ
jgi:hypothetical protein